MTQNKPVKIAERRVFDRSDGLELTDDDILDAMQHIPGYLDINTEDFRTLYHLAYRHAQERQFAGVTAGRLMRIVSQPLQQSTTLEMAARIISDSGCKGLPVVDDRGCVIGMLTETDFLNRLKSESFLDLLVKMFDDGYKFTHNCHETTVSAAMAQPAISVGHDANVPEMLEAFQKHGGRSMPVVDGSGRLLGLLLRKDFLSAYKLGVSM